MANMATTKMTAIQFSWMKRVMACSLEY